MISEQTAESVTSTDVPVAIDPSLLNAPIDPQAATGGSADNELLKHKLGLANSHAKKAKAEADDARQQLSRLQAEIAEMKALQQSAAQKSLEDQGAYKDLWTEAKRTVSERDATIVELRAQLATTNEKAEQERLKAAVTSQLSQANAVNPQQLYQLLAPQLRLDDQGNAAVLSGGVEQPVGEYLASLKQAPEWQHHFGASSEARGMGSTTTSSVTPGRENPYRTGNLTEAVLMERDNPELAAALKKEAQRGG